MSERAKSESTKERSPQWSIIYLLTPSGLFSWRGAVRDGVQLMSSVYNYIDVLTPSGLFSWRGAVRDGVQLMLQVNMILIGIPRIQT